MLIALATNYIKLRLDSDSQIHSVGILPPIARGLVSALHP